MDSQIEQQTTGNQGGGVGRTVASGAGADAGRSPARVPSPPAPGEQGGGLREGEGEGAERLTPPAPRSAAASARTSPGPPRSPTSRS